MPQDSVSETAPPKPADIQPGYEYFRTGVARFERWRVKYASATAVSLEPPNRGPLKTLHRAEFEMLMRAGIWVRITWPAKAPAQDTTQEGAGR